MMSRLVRKGRRLAPAPAATVGILLAALGTGFGIAITNAEGLVAKGFTAALSAEAATKAGAPGSEALVAGTEEFWLAGPGRSDRANARIEPAAWAAPTALGLAAGDHITITSGKSQRVLEVVSVSDVAADGVTRIEKDKADGGQVLVTCRDTSGGKDGQLIRFLASAGSSGTSIKPERAL